MLVSFQSMLIPIRPNLLRAFRRGVMVSCNASPRLGFLLQCQLPRDMVTAVSVQRVNIDDMTIDCVLGANRRDNPWFLRSCRQSSLVATASEDSSCSCPRTQRRMTRKRRCLADWEHAPSVFPGVTCDLRLPGLGYDSRCKLHILQHRPRS